MKIDYVKLENYSRLVFIAFFLLLFIGGIYGIIKGNYLHIIVIAGSLLLTYITAKNK